MTASKKTASKKKRTPAQRRATANLVAMNKKKRAASKRKTTSRKKTTRRNPVRPLRSRAKKKAAARKRNPATKRYAIALEAFVPGQMVYVVSYNWRNGVWIVDTVKDRALRGTRQNMKEMANAVIQQLQKDNPKYNGQVYLDPV